VSDILLVALAIGGLLLFAFGLAAFVIWMWFAPLYHPIPCHCRRCDRRERGRQRLEARLRKASRR
jgi:hypothetical protein